MKITKDLIGGVKVIKTNIFTDERGIFSKFLCQEVLESIGINFEAREGFYSVSKKNVIRGMHFQVPPFEHDKIVFILKGEIEDVVLNIKKGSKYYGQYKKINLKERDGKLISIPKGFAHGFKVLSDEATMFYLTSKEYSKEHDSGILWSSFGCKWNLSGESIISKKDLNLIHFDLFKSPFKEE